MDDLHFICAQGDNVHIYMKLPQRIRSSYSFVNVWENIEDIINEKQWQKKNPFIWHHTN